MNKTIAASLLKLNLEELYYEDLVKAEKKAVFDIKNFIFWNTYIPKLFEAKRNQLIKIENAVSAFIEDNELEQKDEKSGFFHEVPCVPKHGEVGKALENLNLEMQHSVGDFFASYERASQNAKLVFSKAQSAKYAALGLENLMCLEQSFQILFLHLFNPLFQDYKEYVNREVKLKESLLSSKLMEALTGSGLKEVSLENLSAARVSGSDQEKKTIWTEWYRLAKIYDLPETKAAK